MTAPGLSYSDEGFLKFLSPVEIEIDEALWENKDSTKCIPLLDSLYKVPKKINLKNFRKLDFSSHKKPNEILEVIFPKKILVKDGKAYESKISSVPANQTQLISIERKFYLKLNEEKAEEIGISRSRRAIFSSLFDELIRQESVVSPERGLIMMLLKLELEDQLENYQKTFNSSLNYGIRKQILLGKLKANLLKKKEALEISNMEKGNNLSLKTDFLASQKYTKKKENQVFKELNGQINDYKKILQQHKEKIQDMILNSE